MANEILSKVKIIGSKEMILFVKEYLQESKEWSVWQLKMEQPNDQELQYEIMTDWNTPEFLLKHIVWKCGGEIKIENEYETDQSDEEGNPITEKMFIDYKSLCKEETE